MSAEQVRGPGVLLAVSWTLGLLVIATITKAAPFVILEPWSVEHRVVLAAYLATSVFWIPGAVRRAIVCAHLLVVGAVLVFHPLTTTFGRDGALVAMSLHFCLVLWRLTPWRIEGKVLAAALLVGIALSETALSALRGPRSLPDYGSLIGTYGEGGFLVPDLRLHVVGPNGPVEFVTNSRGFRNREDVPYRKPPGRRRVFMVGDSFVAGYRTDQERTVGRVLEARLRSAGGRVDVVVVGVGHPGAAVEWLDRHAFRFEPDLVVLGVTLGNDISQSWIARRRLPGDVLESLFLPSDAYAQAYLELLPVKLDRTLGSWRLYSRTSALFRQEAITSWFQDPPTRVHLFDAVHSLGHFFVRRPLPLVEYSYADLVACLAEADKACASKSVPLLIVLFPQRFQVSLREWQATVYRYGLAAEAFDVERPNRRIREGCAALGMTCLDLLPGFQAAAGTSLYQARGDMHWNDAGHALAARLIAAEVRRRYPSIVPLTPASGRE